MKPSLIDLKQRAEEDFLIVSRKLEHLKSQIVDIIKEYDKKFEEILIRIQNLEEKK